MLNWIRARFPSAAITLSNMPAADAQDAPGAVRYPPVDPGIPLVPVSQVIGGQVELIGRIFRASGLSPEDFVRRVDPVIQNLARYVHLLPATRDYNHVGSGGLFRFVLEIGFFSLQSATGTIFPVGGSTERRHFMQPRWRFAAFLGGVCSQIYRPLINITVHSPDDTQWPALTTPLFDWAEEVQADRYYVRWQARQHSTEAQANAAFAITQIVPRECLQYLAVDNNLIIPAMTAAITGAPDIGAEENPLSRIIAPITSRVVAEDIKHSSTKYGSFTLGAHLEPYIIDCMRRCVKTGEWRCNIERGTVFVTPSGIFLAWEAAAGRIQAMMTRDNFVGLPKDIDTLADMLCESGVFERNSQLRYWPALGATPEADVSYVKLATPSIIFPLHFEMPAVAGSAPALPQFAADPEALDATLPKAPAAESAPPPFAPTADDAPPPSVAAAPAEGATDSVPEPSAASRHAERLMATLKKESAWLMQEIINRQREGTTTGLVCSLPQGVGISNEEISAHGQPPTVFIEELAARQWLWIDKTKPTRKVHSIPHGGGRVPVIIIKADIALTLGFVLVGAQPQASH